MPNFQSSSSLLKCSSQGLRSFLGQTANLPQISNPDLELEIVAAPFEVTLGERIEFRITAYGFKQRATHEYITVAEDMIVELQVDGPLRAWRHAQRIESSEDGQCRLFDEIDFEPPGGMLGFLLTEDRIRESIQEGMEHRYSVLQQLIESGVIS